MKKSSLVVVGTGIKFLSQLTHEASIYIKKSEKILYLVNDQIFKHWITEINPNNESLDNLYFAFEHRNDSYAAIANYIVSQLDVVKDLCVVMYGHPTFFANPALEAAKIAYKNGHDVMVLPGVSSQDCLYADLMIDPGTSGCQSFDATDFLIYQRKFDPNCHLILYQPDVIGDIGHSGVDKFKGLSVLQEYLLEFYPKDHEIISYEAAVFPAMESVILKSNLINLANIDFSPISTLYVRPLNRAITNKEYLKKLGL